MATIDIEILRSIQTALDDLTLGNFELAHKRLTEIVRCEEFNKQIKIKIDKKEIWKAKDELTKRKTYSTRMLFGFEEGIKFALKQVNKLPIYGVSVCSLSELKLLKDVYLEREEKAHQVKDYRQAHEDSIRRGVIEHVISMQNKQNKWQ